MLRQVILVTGSRGQVGQELQQLAASYPVFEFVFTTSENMPIDDKAAVEKQFAENRPAYCINCAAYTAVDKAESEPELAYRVNAEGTDILSQTCVEHDTRFIHLSTDFVFNGRSKMPYKEDFKTDPLNVYGASKLKGEFLCGKYNPQSTIIRTAWVYSPFGKNFVKTMVTLMQERPVINVVNDQVGAPTYAADLAKCIMQIIKDYHLNRDREFYYPWRSGIYHYCNKGRISWFDFAVAIKELTGSSCIVNPISTEQYPTPAKRPAFSLLDTHKIRRVFPFVTTPDWKASLQQCLKRLK